MADISNKLNSLRSFSKKLYPIGIRLALLVTCFTLSGVIGYLFGHDDGWDLGLRVGKAEALFESKGACVYHNGKKVN